MLLHMGELRGLRFTYNFYVVIILLIRVQLSHFSVAG